MEPSSTQVGAIAVHLVENSLIQESRGRLAPFEPMADDAGIDLLVFDKITGAAVPLQVKSRSNTLMVGGKRSKVVHFEVHLGGLHPDRPGFILGTLLDEDARGIEKAWLVPAAAVPGLAREQPGKYVLRPSKDDFSRDKYTPYRCRDMADVVHRILEPLD